MKVKLLNDTKCPQKGRENDAAWDLFLNSDIKLKPRQKLIINTGVCVQIPNNYAGKLILRSSICTKTKIILKDALVDVGYTGELHIFLENLSFFKTYKFKKNERICSFYCFPILNESLEVVNDLDISNRGNNWNGSSGK